MMELHRENAGLRQTIRFLERGRGQRRGTSDSAGTPPRMTMTRAEVEEYYLGPGGLESVVSPSARGLAAAAAPEARIVVDVEFPPEFGAYLHACRNLRFDEKPDYAAMRSLLRERLPAVRRATQTGLERSTREVDAPTC